MDITLCSTKIGNKTDIDINPCQTKTLSDNDKDIIEMNVTYGAARPDVNAYFLCDYDYTDVGFSATGIVNPETEYEILIEWPLTKPVSTGVFVTGNDVYRVAYKETKNEEMPNLQTDFVKHGTLLVYQPDMHIWIYQYDGSLYWVAGEGFHFEDDGTTMIQYQLWTTQLHSLPSNRLKKKHFWDNIGGYFEKYELSGDFGKYRVMRRKLPTKYAIISILTGYYKHGDWDWEISFRPVYEF